MNAGANGPEVQAHFSPPLLENNKHPSRVLVRVTCCICQGREISPGQLQSKQKLVVRMQRCSGKEARSGLTAWKAPGIRVPHTLCYLCILVSSPQRGLALLCLMILHMVQYSGLSSILTLQVPRAPQIDPQPTSLACHILVAHPRGRITLVQPKLTFKMILAAAKQLQFHKTL